MAKTYESKCSECKTAIKEPPNKPIYVVFFDKYFCIAQCWNKWRGRQAK
jgi:hypothetical protein